MLVYIFFFQKVHLSLLKFDELDCLIQGIHYTDRINVQNECYYYSNPTNPEMCEKMPYDFQHPYPYLVVNIGSGISILMVNSPNDYKRITGSRLDSLNWCRATLCIYQIAFNLSCEKKNVFISE